MTWKNDYSLGGGYMASTMHTSHLVTVANKLKTVLGNHLVNRNVLLSSSISSYHSNAYTWTTSYCTLMSAGQLTGTFATRTNKYDDGEANYKLPLFNYADYKIGIDFWLRNIYGLSYDSDFTGRYYAYGIVSAGIDGIEIDESAAVRPLIYVR